MKTPAIFQYSKTDQGDADDGAPRSVAKYDDPFLDLSYTPDNDVFGDESIKNKNIKIPKNTKIKKKETPVSPTKAMKLEMDVLNVSKTSDQEGGKFLDSSVDEVKLTCAHQISGETDKGEQRTGSPGLVEPFTNNTKVLVKNSPHNKAPVTNTKNHSNEGDSNIDSENFLENLLTIQDSLLKPAQTQRETTKVNVGDKTSASDKLPQRPWTQCLHTDWMNFFEVCNMNIYSFACLL